jgi:lipopolysaccharide export system ATP-binding protein
MRRPIRCRGRAATGGNHAGARHLTEVHSLDEPFAGIDPIAVTDIQKIIFHLRDRGIGILITYHNVRETLRITDRAYIVHGGIIFKSGTPASLAEDEEVRRIYLGAEFRLD